MIAFESFEIAQTTADKASNYAWGGIGLQVLSNALIGGFSGYFGGSIGVSGVGFATVFYTFTEVVMPSDSHPSATAGAGFFLSTIYGNRMANWLTGKLLFGDFIGALISFGSDTAEGGLKKYSEKIIRDSKQNPTLQKSVIATTI